MLIGNFTQLKYSIVYAILVDLTDNITQLLGKRFIDISIERVFNSLYCFRQALSEGQASDPISYLAERKCQLF